VFDRGDLAQAIRASSSVPFYFEPIYVGDSYLIDGSASMPIPVRIVRDMGADVVIAVNLDGFYTTSLKNRKSKSPFFPQMIGVTLDLLRYHLSYECAREADIVVTPELLLNESWKKFVNGNDIILKGEQAMKNKLALLKKKL
jgi:NTE family protein